MFGPEVELPCYIIAEIGGNFETLEEAIHLVDLAAECGVDAVKLQTYRANTVSSKCALFDMENTGVTSQYELFRRYEVSEELHASVFAYVEEKGLDWFSTPSHEADVADFPVMDPLDGLEILGEMTSEEADSHLETVLGKGRASHLHRHPRPPHLPPYLGPTPSRKR